MLPTYSQVKSSNAERLRAAYANLDPKNKQKTRPPVGVFIGGTSGIGEGMARVFAKYTNGNASIIIVGRNKVAGERILSELEKPQTGDTEVTRLFIQCDVSLMRNVVATARELTSMLSKINYLVISTGFLDITNRIESKEGLEHRLSISYYARWLFIRELSPLLDVAVTQNGERGVTMSILAAGQGGDIDPEDWEMKKNYSTLKVVFTATTYNDLMVESFAERYPNLPFIHSHPGIVHMPILRRSPSVLLRILGMILFTLGRPFTVTTEESAEWMWWTLLEIEGKCGSFRTDRHGRELGKDESYHGSEKRRKGLLEHTESAVLRGLGVEI